MVFHFNKAHLSDQSIPMWTLKIKGQTYYVNHVVSDAPWNTKETPDSSHTKGALKFRKVDVEIDDQGQAKITCPKITDATLECLMQ